ncbi:MAG: hypothetical protein NT059_12490, partial [Planctomycetota bacterium]|nr:hypothetical protein [Planctomycetota bacterium]
MALNARRLGLLAYLPLLMLAMTGEPTSVIAAPRDDADAIARQEQLITRVRDAKGAVPVVFV